MSMLSTQVSAWAVHMASWQTAAAADDTSTKNSGDMPVCSTAVVSEPVVAAGGAAGGQPTSSYL